MVDAKRGAAPFPRALARIARPWGAVARQRSVKGRGETAGAAGTIAPAPCSLAASNRPAMGQAMARRASRQTEQKAEEKATPQRRDAVDEIVAQWRRERPEL